jgi:hypothetical protein
MSRTSSTGSQSDRRHHRQPERGKARKRGACIDPHGYDAGKKIKGNRRMVNRSKSGRHRLHQLQQLLCRGGASTPSNEPRTKHPKVYGPKRKSCFSASTNFGLSGARFKLVIPILGRVVRSMCRSFPQRVWEVVLKPPWRLLRWQVVG